MAQREALDSLPFVYSINYCRNSGLAWALSTDPNEVAIVSQWDSKFSRNFDQDKVPSRISYSDNGAVTSWGYDMKPNDHHLSWFKLLMADATKAS